VLAVLSRGDSYGYKIAQDASGVVEISESTLYPILRRMEQQGSLQTYAQEYNSRLRKYYTVTPRGEERLSEFRESWKEVKTIVDYILEEGKL
jgi:PadR family transcriptional regulator PadR